MACLSSIANSSSAPAKPLIAPEIAEELQSLTDAEKQVIVHCCFPASFQEGMLIRIWPTTFLFDDNSSHRSHLIHHENISLFPMWTVAPSARDYWFTLIFSGLPSGCETFSLREVIPESGGFCVKDIVRTASDVYRIHLV